ncbi:MAG: glycosyltransferase family 4 protein [Candidatus Falkowbacteria bacterium]
MKTLFLTLDYPPQFGGVASVYGAVVRHWPKEDEIKVITNEHQALVNNKLPLIKWLVSCQTLWRELKSTHYDQVLIGQVLPLGTAMWLVNFFKPTPYVVFVHGMDLGWAIKHPRKKWLVKKILNQAKCVISSNSVAAEMAKKLVTNPDKIFIVHPGIEPDQYQSQPDLVKSLLQKYNLTDKKIILSYGRLVKRKGFDQIISAMPNILAQTPDAYYVIGGSGSDEKYLKEIAAALPDNLRSHVIFLGQLTEAEKWTWLEASRLYAMPSRNIAGDYEGFGIVFIEANLAGRPVIGGNSGGVAEAVVSDLNGFLVDPEKSDEIVKAITILLQDTNYAERLGQQGRERAMQFFNWQKQVGLIYRHIIQ